VTCLHRHFDLGGTLLLGDKEAGYSMSVRQRDILAAVKGTVAAGVEVARVEVCKDGRIVIVAGKPSEQSVTETNALDAWMAKNARST
jgi:hypothetical protein